MQFLLLYIIIIIITSILLEEPCSLSEITWHCTIFSCFFKNVNKIVFLCLQVSTDVFVNCVYPSVKEIIEGGWAQATPETFLISLALQRCWGVCICDGSILFLVYLLFFLCFFHGFNDNKDCIKVNIQYMYFIQSCVLKNTNWSFP